MGKIYAFWSPLHGQCGTTASMVAAAYAMRRAGSSVVLVHSQSVYADLEHLFHTRTEKRVVFDGIGLDGLCYTIKAKDLDKQDLDRAMFQIDEDFYLLPSASKRTDTERESVLQYIITEKLPIHYDYIFVDVGAGHSEITEAIRSMADLNFIVVSQNKMTLQDFPCQNTVLLCGNYDRNRKLNLTSLKQMYPECRVFAIPYCTEFGDAIADSRVHHFFQANERLLPMEETQEELSIRKIFRKAEDSTGYFFKELRALQKHNKSDEVRKSNEVRFNTLALQPSQEAARYD